MGRADGKKVKGLPYFDLIIPHIMEKRYDAYNLCKLEIEYAPVGEFIRKWKSEGKNLQYMAILIAAWLRTLKHKPEFNRFIMNKKIYMRNHICVSFVVLREGGGETVSKVYFDGNENVFEVQEKIEKSIADSRDASKTDKVDWVLNKIFSFGFIAGFAVSMLKFLDKHNMLPRSIIDASPFHTSFFITNMASIKMNAVYHHLYEFGTTSIFCGLGAKTKIVKSNRDGEIRAVEVVPLNTTTDERICSGAVFAEGFALLKKFMKHPELLEESAESQERAEASEAATE